METNILQQWVFEHWKGSMRFRGKMKRRFMSIVKIIQRYDKQIPQTITPYFIHSDNTYRNHKYSGKYPESEALRMYAIVIIKNKHEYDYRFNIVLNFENDTLTIRVLRKSNTAADKWEILHKPFSFQTMYFCYESYKQHLATKDDIIDGIECLLMGKKLLVP